MEDSQEGNLNQNKIKYLKVVPLSAIIPTVCYDVPCTFDNDDDSDVEIKPTIVNDRFASPDKSQNERISDTNKRIIQDWFETNVDKSYPTKLQMEKLIQVTDLSSKQINLCLNEARKKLISPLNKADCSNENSVIAINGEQKNIVVKYCDMKNDYLTNQQLSVFFGFLYENRYNPIPSPQKMRELIINTGLSCKEVQNWLGHAIELILPDMLHITRRKELSSECRIWHITPYQASSPQKIWNSRRKLKPNQQYMFKGGKQRLPLHSKNILMNWLQKNHCSPYPSEEEKLKLSYASNLSVLQINNWFINARRRYLHKIILENVSKDFSGTSEVQNTQHMEFQSEMCKLVVSEHNYSDSFCEPIINISSTSSGDDEDVYQKQLKLTLKALQSKPIVVLERLKM